MYSLKNLVTKSPIQLSGALTGALNLLILLGTLDWDGTTVAAVNSVLILFLGLFVAQTTANKAVLEEIEEVTGQSPPGPM